MRFEKLMPETVEGKILALRFIWGLIVGVLYWALDGRVVYFSGNVENSIIGWVVAIVLYFATIPLVQYMYPDVKLKWKLGKGVTVYFTAWLLTWFALYDITTPP